MEYKGFTLDGFQEKAVREIDSNNSVVVSAPTGAGKTLIADYIINEHVGEKKIIYTAPIKALSNQKYKDFCEEYGEEKIGLMTGDIVRNSEAPMLIMTTEVYRNMALTDDQLIEEVAYVIFDEIHFINDRERGYIWEESVIFSEEHVRFLCLSATIPNAEEFAEWIQSIQGHEVKVVREGERHVPLEKKLYDSKLGVTSLRSMNQSVKALKNRKKKKSKVRPPSHINLVKKIDKKGRTPCIFFVFSRKGCEENAVELMEKKGFKRNKEIQSMVDSKLSEASQKIHNLNSTTLLKKVLPYGIAFHHAGLMPITKEIVEDLFEKGLIKVLYTTETFAVGINMPAKTVCFQGARKYDGIGFRYLTSKEYFQIAGRAGRRGIDKRGFVYLMIDRRDFDYDELKRMTGDDMVPLKSQFQLSVNTVLNLIKMHSEEEIKRIIEKSFHNFQKKKGKKKGKKGKKGKSFYKEYLSLKKRLKKMKYIISEEDEEHLTWKGEFASKIYVDELLMGEMFGTDFKEGLNEYEILLLISALSYEPKEKTEFFNQKDNKFVKKLKKKIGSVPFLKDEERLNNIKKMTSLIDPCYHGKTVFESMNNTNMSEGDVVRIFRQLLDRLGQLKDASDDEHFRYLVKNCMSIIGSAMEDIDVL